MAVNYINFKCETGADLKREGTDERPLRKPKPQKCSVITIKSVSDFFLSNAEDSYVFNKYFFCIFTQNFAIISMPSCNNAALC